MRNQKHSKLMLMCAASGLALSVAAHAQEVSPAVEQVTVTGSRVIADITQSPTPLTVVTADQLQATTPTTIPDALNKLPDFIGGNKPNNKTAANVNGAGNTLNLRNLGASRTLVLLDGRRVAPSNQDGTTNVDILPQMLMSRVDVITGGASAMYGSDAVAGVVNFILDKKFDGFKYDINAGISNYGDAAQQKIGIAWGTGLFGGRGHYEMSARAFQQDMVMMRARSYGREVWVQAGSGTAASPYYNVINGRLYNYGMAGNTINNCGRNCPLVNYTFTAGGNIAPLVHGIPTRTQNLESGGDGGYQYDSTMQSRQRQIDFYNRFSYDITPNVTAFIDASWAESANFGRWSNFYLSANANRPNAFFTDNPFISPAAQQALRAAATAAGNFVPPPVVAQNGSIAPAVPAGTPYFQMAGYQPQIIDGQQASTLNALYITKGLDQNFGMTAGLSGTLSNFSWDLAYSHQLSRVGVQNPNNTDAAKYLAAQDAVIAPAGTLVNGVNVGGTPQCWVTTQPQFAALYPGCIPMNVFDPVRGISKSSFDYVSHNTFWELTQKLDNISGSISGPLFGLGLPAGPITAAISGEMRWRTYDLESNALPSDFVNCTGLRMCTTNGGVAPVLWTQNTNAPVSASDNVWEAALEINVPLLKDFPLAQELTADIAGRHTDYSISGIAETWKLGVNDIVNDSIRLRSTMSLDIRAPNLNDLYQPLGIGPGGFNDRITGVNSGTQTHSRGNPALKPEVAHTYTVGAVLTPDVILPRLVLSLDYYQTHMSQAITQVNGGSTVVQDICIASAPTYSSPYCLLVERPIKPGQPGYTSPANYPTALYNAPQNTANVQMEGWNFELDYNFDWADVWDAVPGTVNLRHLVTYQPVLQTQSLQGVAFTWTAQPKVRMTSFLSYSVGDWNLDIQNLWMSGWKKATSPNIIYAAPRITSYNAMDVTVSRRFDMWGGSSKLYLSVQNIGNTRAPLWPTNAGNPGLTYPAPGIYSDIGRYFIIGLKGNF